MKIYVLNARKHNNGKQDDKKEQCAEDLNNPKRDAITLLRWALIQVNTVDGMEATTYHRIT